jgi:hypothetical protein
MTLAQLGNWPHRPGLTVFAVGGDARFPLDACAAAAKAHYGLEIGAAVAKRYDLHEGRLQEDVVPLLVRIGAVEAALRNVHIAPISPARAAAAQVASVASGGEGMRLLAARANYAWHIELTENSDEDASAWRLAACLAFIGLGPILSADQSELVGSKTARSRTKM